MLMSQILMLLPKALPPATATYAGQASMTGAATLFSFAALPIGAASTDRHVAVLVYSQGGGGLPSSVTVAGQSCTAKVTNTGAGEAAIYLTDAPVTTGTTATVAVNYGSNVNVCGVGTWALTGLLSTTATDTETANGNGVAMNLSISALGCAIAGGGGGDDGTFTATNITENFDAVISAGNRVYTGASRNDTTAVTPAITFNKTISALCLFVAASFR